VTSFSVAPQELAKNIICLLYGYMMIYRSTLPIWSHLLKFTTYYELNIHELIIMYSYV